MQNVMGLPSVETSDTSKAEGRRQKRTAIVSVLIATLIILFPLYYDYGGLLGGIRFGFLFHPLKWDYDVGSRPVLAMNGIQLQLICVGCWTLALLLVQDKETAPKQQIAFWLWLAACTVLILANVFCWSTVGPRVLWLIFPVFISGHFLLFLRLSVLSLLTVTVIFLLGQRKQKQRFSLFLGSIGGGSLCLLAGIFAEFLMPNKAIGYPEWNERAAFYGLCICPLGALMGGWFCFLWSRRRLSSVNLL